MLYIVLYKLNKTTHTFGVNSITKYDENLKHEANEYKQLLSYTVKKKIFLLNFFRPIECKNKLGSKPFDTSKLLTKPNLSFRTVNSTTYFKKICT